MAIKKKQQKNSCTYAILIQEALSRTYKNAAGYTFLSQYFYLSWGRTSNTSDLILESYTQRETTEPRRDRQKNIYTPQRVSPADVGTHTFVASTGYKKYVFTLFHKKIHVE